MKKLTMDNVVGFVLAILFALVIGVSMWALLVGEYMNTVMNEQTRHTLRIVGFAGALAALSTWWVQNFAARRGFTIRFLFAMMIFAVAFGAFGGLLRFGFGTTLALFAAAELALAATAVRLFRPETPSVEGGRP